MNKNNTWQSYTIGFSNLTENQKQLIEKKLDNLVKELEKENIITEALTSDGGEF